LKQSGNVVVSRGVEGAVVGRPLSEEQLVEQARGGDAAAFGALVRRHQDVAFRTAMLITQDAAEAEEAAQDALVKAWRALGRFRAGEPLRPWLLAIVANEARNRRRGAGRRAGLAHRAAEAATWPGATPPRDGPGDVVIAAERRSTLLGALATLREEDRLVLGCRFLLELGEAETAAALGVRPGTVKSRTSRALGRLRDALGEAADA
jgi:RNA polymerase sigma-70 factor (ECF subfamily)